MPYKTPYGTHYHLTYGCHGATESCGTEGLTPCSDCCGAGGGRDGEGEYFVGVGSPAGASGAEGTFENEGDAVIDQADGSGAVVDTSLMDANVVNVQAGASVGGVKGTLIKLDRLLPQEVRDDLNSRDGVRTVVIASADAPKISGVFVEDGYSYSVDMSDDIVDAGIIALEGQSSAPSVDLLPSEEGDRDDTDLPSIMTVDPSDPKALTDAAWEAALAEDEERQPLRDAIQREQGIHDITALFEHKMRFDPDVSETSRYVADQVAELLAACDVVRRTEDDHRDPYTMTLASQFVTFCAGPNAGLGSSQSDYCAQHLAAILDHYEIRLRDDADGDQILAQIRERLDETALYPDREYKELTDAGVPIHRSDHLDALAKNRESERERLANMGEQERLAMWDEEATAWAKQWASIRELRGEKRPIYEMIERFDSGVEARKAIDKVVDAAARKTITDAVRRHGDAFNLTMADEVKKTYERAAYTAINELTSRRQEAKEAAKRRSAVIEQVRWAQKYDVDTPLSALDPEERRSLALALANKATENPYWEDRLDPRELRYRKMLIEQALNNGIVADIKQITGEDPMTVVNAACADAIIRGQSQSQS